MNNISKLGYSRYSPYRNSPFLDIKSPSGLIDMSNTDIPLLGIGLQTGVIKPLLPGTGLHSFPGDKVIREIKLPKIEFQYGGSTPQEWEKQIRDVEKEIGDPSKWTMKEYNKLQDILNQYKFWRQNTKEGKAVIDYSNEPNEYIVPLPMHLRKSFTYLEPGSFFLPSRANIPENTFSSERATSIGGENGEPAFLVPSFKYGKPLRDEFNEFKKTGHHIGGPFKTWQEAQEYGKLRHKFIDEGYESLPTPIRRWGKDYSNESFGLPNRFFKKGGSTTNTTTLDPTNSLPIKYEQGVGILPEVIVKARSGFKDDEYQQAFNEAKDWYNQWFSSPMYAQIIKNNRGYPYNPPSRFGQNFNFLRPTDQLRGQGVASSLFSYPYLPNYDSLINYPNTEENPVEERELILPNIKYNIDRKNSLLGKNTLGISTLADQNNKNILLLPSYPTLTFNDKLFRSYDDLLTTMVHEVGHGINKNGEIIPPREKISVMARQPSSYLSSPMHAQDLQNEDFWNRLKNNDLTLLKQREKDFNYLTVPDEVIQRIRALRFNLQRQGIYNPFNSQFKSEYLENYIPVPSADPLEQLRQIYKDYDIEYLMNNTTRNKSKASNAV